MPSHLFTAPLMSNFLISSAPSEPPGSLVHTASIPLLFRYSTNNLDCVLLPAPSTPSKVINFPFNYFPTQKLEKMKLIMMLSLLKTQVLMI